MPPSSPSAKPWSVHTVVFDLDDTLFAEAEFVRSGFAAVAQWLETRGMKGFGGAALAVFEEGLRGRIFDAALARLGQPADADLVRQMVEVYRDHVPRLSLLPDAAACLDALGTSCRLALLTDGYLSVQRRKLAALGIAARFQSVVFSDALGRENWKPSPAGFRLIMQQLPGESRGYVYVADNPHKDFLGPRSLGWKTIRIRRPESEHSAYEPADHEAADVEVADLRRVRDLIAPALAV